MINYQRVWYLMITDVWVMGKLRLLVPEKILPCVPPADLWNWGLVMERRSTVYLHWQHHPTWNSQLSPFSNLTCPVLWWFAHGCKTRLTLNQNRSSMENPSNPCRNGGFPAGTLPGEKNKHRLQRWWAVAEDTTEDSASLARIVLGGVTSTGWVQSNPGAFCCCK